MDSAEKTTTLTTSSLKSSFSSSSWWERAKRRPIDGKALVTIVLLSVLWVMCSSHVFSSSSSVGGDVKALNDDDVNDDGLLPIAKEELEEVLREEENG